MINDTTYILLKKCDDDSIHYMAAARNKADLFRVMKIHMYVIEQEYTYSFEYIKKNLDYFDYISDYLPSEIAEFLKQYECKTLEYAI